MVRTNPEWELHRFAALGIGRQVLAHAVDEYMNRIDNLHDTRWKPGDDGVTCAPRGGILDTPEELADEMKETLMAWIESIIDELMKMQAIYETLPVEWLDKTGERVVVDA